MATNSPPGRGKAALTAKIGALAVAAVVATVGYFEGTVLKTYKDPIGIVTACTGHTGPELKMGQVYTTAQCEEMLYGDLLKHAGDLDCVKVPLSQNETAALLSFTFNVGRGSFCASTLVRKFNAGDAVGGCRELLRWTRAGGRELQGLVNRRQAEYALCMKDRP